MTDPIIEDNFEDLERLFNQPKPELSEAQQEFRTWMKKNRDHFVKDDYTIEEIIDRARLADFSTDLIIKELSNFKDAIGGTDIDSRSAQEFYKFEYARQVIAQMNKAQEDAERAQKRKLTGLDELWVSLAEQSSGYSHSEAA